MLSEGKSQTAVAEALGVNRATVFRWVNRDDIREWINQQAQEYIQSLPNALALSKNVLDISKRQTEKAISRDEHGNIVSVNSDFIDTKILDSALREVDNLRKAVGITPTNSTSIVIGNLVLGDQLNTLAPNVQKILDHQLGDILDVEVEDPRNE